MTRTGDTHPEGYVIEAEGAASEVVASVAVSASLVEADSTGGSYEPLSVYRLGASEEAAPTASTALVDGKTAVSKGEE